MGFSGIFEHLEPPLQHLEPTLQHFEPPLQHSKASQKPTAELFRPFEDKNNKLSAFRLVKPRPINESWRNDD